jgi:hypothetical protein
LQSPCLERVWQTFQLNDSRAFGMKFASNGNAMPRSVNFKLCQASCSNKRRNSQFYNLCQVENTYLFKTHVLWLLRTTKWTHSRPCLASQRSQTPHQRHEIQLQLDLLVC